VRTPEYVFFFSALAVSYDALIFCATALDCRGLK
jgi:hypothetical protein